MIRMLSRTLVTRFADLRVLLYVVLKLPLRSTSVYLHEAYRSGHDFMTVGTK